ncbi:MAG: hypothetical protein ACE5HD_10030 [Acidobacteriota bacterium]
MGPKMRTMSSRLFLTSLFVLLVSLLPLPARPGGRDVPDPSSHSSSPAAPVDVTPPPCPPSQVTLSVTMSGIRLESGVDARGRWFVRPALLGQLERALWSLVARRAPDNSCLSD